MIALTTGSHGLHTIDTSMSGDEGMQIGQMLMPKLNARVEQCRLQRA